MESCEIAEGYTSDGSDCDDADASVHPDATETCDDGRDDDCDALTDCEDADCMGSCDEDCTSGWDEDGDGLIDRVG